VSRAAVLQEGAEGIKGQACGVHSSCCSHHCQMYKSSVCDSQIDTAVATVKAIVLAIDHMALPCEQQHAID
jgi:hypothetical protein